MSNGLPALIETMRVTHGTLPLVDRHVARLSQSCQALQLLPPPDVTAEARAHGLRPPGDRVVRIHWDGATLTWDDREVGAAPTRVAIVQEVHTGYLHKTNRREVFDRAVEQARERGAEEPLLLTADGHVAEAARYAVAWVDGNALRMPDLSLSILASVGRARLVELAGDLGFTVEPGRYPSDVLAGRPVVLINAVHGVVPVALLDGLPLPPDPRFREAAERFWPSA